MGLAVSDLPEVGQERVIEEIAAAREWGLRSTFNAVAILFHEPVDDVEILDREGVLGPDLVWVHMNYASDAQLRRVAESGGAIASCPECELAAGIGRPVTERFLRAGGRPTFGVDMVPYISGDLLTQARIAMQVGRLLGADEGMAAGRAPKEVAPDCETVLRALTVWGAEALGLGDRIGTLRVGKQADLLVVRGDDPNTFPVHDPYATVVAQTQPHNIDTVVVAGEVRKSKRRLAAEWAPVRERLRESAAFLTETVAKNGGFQPQPPVELPW